MIHEGSKPRSEKYDKEWTSLIAMEVVSLNRLV